MGGVAQVKCTCGNWIHVEHSADGLRAVGMTFMHPVTNDVVLAADFTVTLACPVCRADITAKAEEVLRSVPLRGEGLKKVAIDLGDGWEPLVVAPGERGVTADSRAFALLERLRQLPRPPASATITAVGPFRATGPDFCPSCGNDLQGLPGERWMLEGSDPQADPYRLATPRCPCGALRADGKWYLPAKGSE